MALPTGSTPVDFAYAVHTEVGNRTIGARVNGKLAPLSSQLQHGDRVEILTSKSEQAAPSQDWLKFVGSPRARTKIRQWFSKERREEAIERGKELLTKALRKHHLPLQRTVTSESLLAVARTSTAGTSRRSTRPSARTRSAPTRWSRSCWSTWAVRRGPRRTWPRTPGSPSPCAPEPRTRASWCREPRTST